MSTVKVREDRARRIAARRGYTLEKSRLRDPRAAGYGGFILSNTRGKYVILGGHDFSATLEEIEAFLGVGDTAVAVGVLLELNALKR
jgi:hypothetical protein